MKTFKSIIIMLLFAILTSCGVAKNQYSYYNVTVVDDGNGGRAYYPHVYVRSYEVRDTLATVSFIDESNHLYVICGRTIIVETVVKKRNDVYFYDYHRPEGRVYFYSRPPRYHYHYRYTRPRPNPYYNPPYHGGGNGHHGGGSNYRPPQGGGSNSHGGRVGGGNSSHRSGGQNRSGVSSHSSGSSRSGSSTRSSGSSRGSGSTTRSGGSTSRGGRH